LMSSRAFGSEDNKVKKVVCLRYAGDKKYWDITAYAQYFL